MLRDPGLAAAMRADLERRIAEISRADSKAFGHIGPTEWALSIVLFVVLPLLLWWWFA